MTIFTRIWNWIRGAAKSVFYRIVCPALSRATTTIIGNEDLQALALDAVRTAAMLDADGGAKHAAACAAFVAALRSAGYEALRDSIVDTMVQLAYTVYKDASEGRE